MANETDILSRLRKGYAAQGFDVFVRPRIERPDGPDLRPDLMAKSSTQTVLVGVRAPVRLAEPGGETDGQAEATRLRLLAEAAQDRPDWTFRLVLVDGESAAPELPSQTTLAGKVADARRLYRKGDHAPALLFAWALLAAAARRAVAPDEGEFGDASPRAMAAGIVSMGLGAQDDITWLEPAGDLVASVTAGDLMRPIDKALFDRICMFTLGLCGPAHRTERSARRAFGL